MAKLGRPFTYQSEDERPVTVSLRIPRDLHERMNRYAARHRQSVTELLLDGLRWRLEQDDPRTQSISDLLYYDNTVLQELSKPTHLLDGLIPFDEDLAVFPATKIEPSHDISNYSNAVLQEPQQATPLSGDSSGAPEAAPQPSIALQHYDNMVIQESVQPLPEVDAPLQEYDNTVLQENASQRRGRPATMREPILNLLREHQEEGLTAEQIRALLNAQKPIGDTLQGMRRGNLVRTEGTGREMRYFLSR